MKSVLKVTNMNNANDVNRIRDVVSQSEGVVACYIDRESALVEIVYDSYLLDIDDIIDSMESLGYIIVE